MPKRPKPHIRYTSDHEYHVSNVEEWIHWMEQALTFHGQVREIKAVLKYKGGNRVMGSREFTRWAVANVDHFIPPIDPRLAEIIGE